jgi:hypothetical protein
MVNRAGKATAWTGAVYIGDEFEWSLGDKPFVTHRPCGNEDQLTHVYAIARVKGADYPIIEVWPMEKLLKHRAKYNKVGDNHYSYKHFEMYGRKVALLQVLKYIPRSIELATAFQLDASAEMGTQHLEIKDVPSIIEGTVIPETAPEPEAPSKGPEATICGDCAGQNGNHAPGCKYDKPASPEPTETATEPPLTEMAQTAIEPKATRYSVQIKEIRRRTKAPLRVLTLLSNDGLWDAAVFHESFFEYLDEKAGKFAIIEVVVRKAKDGRDFTHLEHLIEVDGVKFVDDKPASSGE